MSNNAINITLTNILNKTNENISCAKIGKIVIIYIHVGSTSHALGIVSNSVIANLSDYKPNTNITVPIICDKLIVDTATLFSSDGKLRVNGSGVANKTDLFIQMIYRTI